ncbi:Protein MAIN-LIKE 2 [Glycine soja]
MVPLFGEGPRDLMLLQSYKEHTTRRVWIDEPKAVLKLVSHGGNVMPHPTQPTMKGYVGRSRLNGLYEAWYMSTNKGIVNAFIQRWHKETSSFHLLVGENNPQ